MRHITYIANDRILSVTKDIKGNIVKAIGIKCEVEFLEMDYVKFIVDGKEYITKLNDEVRVLCYE